MKYYLILFTDCTDTIGKQTSKTAMMKDAKHYCKAWGLDCTVQNIIEITEEEYNSRIR